MKHTSKASNNLYSPNQLKDLIRLLATQNTMWTRNYIVSYIANLDDIVVLENRIIMNLIDIKNIFAMYYNNELATNLESLLRDYLNKLIDTLRLLKINFSSPNTKYQQELIVAQENWYKAGNELARFLSEINPNWDFNQLQTLILDHIEMTTDQMSQLLQGKYAFEVHQYDFIEYHSLMIGDYISDGIINMFY